MTLNFTGNENLRMSEQLGVAGVPEYCVVNQNDPKNEGAVILPAHCPKGSKPWLAALMAEYVNEHPTVLSLYNKNARDVITEVIKKDPTKYQERFFFDPIMFGEIIEKKLAARIETQTDSELSHLLSNEEQVKNLFSEAYSEYSIIVDKDLSNEFRGELLSRFMKSIGEPLANKMFGMIPEKQCFECVKVDDSVGNRKSRGFSGSSE